MLGAARWIDSPDGVLAAMAQVKEACLSLGDTGLRRQWGRMELSLMQVRDIRNTLGQLAAGGVPDDVELFEIKSLAFACVEIGTLIGEVLPSFRQWPDMGPVAEALDPDRTGALSFHLYDSYSDRLRDLRKALSAVASDLEGDPEEMALQTECLQEESRVRQALADRLRPYARLAEDALEAVGEVDLLHAKAQLALRWDMAVPEAHCDLHIDIRGMRNPEIASRLEEKDIRYQPVDIRLDRGVTLLTGANMAGKSVALSTLALCQAMMQFGFAVPARSAGLPVVDGVRISMGDGQSALEGLSSYAAEMQRIDSLVSTARTGHWLLLVDEPARTTNPEEGEAIAAALATVLDTLPSLSVITTHYSVRGRWRRLRVKGLSECRETTVDPKLLPRLMDYTLVEDSGGQPPREALRIAEWLGVNPQLIRLSTEYIKKRQYAKE